MDSDDQFPQYKRQRRTSPSPTPHDDACDAPSPPSNAEQQASSPLLSLTVELFTEITSYLDDVDFHNLITTCAVLYSHLYLDDVIRRFSAGAGVESVFCLEGARKDEIGWKPFTIIDARYGNASEWGGSDDAGEVDPPRFVVFTYLEHDFEEVQHRPTRDYLVLYVEDEAVWVDWTGSPKWLAEHLDERQLAQWEDVHDRMVLATPEMIKQRFTCPECDGSGEVLYGFLLTAMK